jgi:hypothetical protein
MSLLCLRASIITKGPDSIAGRGLTWVHYRAAVRRSTSLQTRADYAAGEDRTREIASGAEDPVAHPELDRRVPARELPWTAYTPTFSLSSTSSAPTESLAVWRDLHQSKQKRGSSAGSDLRRRSFGSGLATGSSATVGDRRAPAAEIGATVRSLSRRPSHRLKLATANDRRCGHPQDAHPVAAAPP